MSKGGKPRSGRGIKFRRRRRHRFTDKHPWEFAVGKFKAAVKIVRRITTFIGRMLLALHSPPIGRGEGVGLKIASAARRIPFPAASRARRVQSTVPKRGERIIAAGDFKFRRRRRHRSSSIFNLQSSILCSHSYSLIAQCSQPIFSMILSNISAQAIVVSCGITSLSNFPALTQSIKCCA